MPVPLAWHNLVHNRLRTAVATAGVAFAVILVFMQLGFLGAVETTATLIYDALDYDLVIRSRSYLHLSDPRTFSRNRLHQVEALPAVESVRPLHVELNQWRNPANGRVRGILVLGVAPLAPAFAVPEICEKAALLTDPEFLLIDRRSRTEFGPHNGRQFSAEDHGVRAEIGAQRVRIVGTFELGAGLASDGAVLLNEQGFRRLFPGRSPDDISVGLVKLRPGASADEVAQRLRPELPPDVELLTKAEVQAFELHRWIHETAIGMIFSIGVFVAVIVGTSIAYQVLSTDVANLLPEYATLKAMGYSNSYLSAVVLQQAISLAILGFVPGLILSQGLYQLTSAFANIPITMTWVNFGLVLCLTLGMCAVSGLAALRKALQADPADLF